jgi:FkbM family methyltransferase
MSSTTIPNAPPVDFPAEVGSKEFSAVATARDVLSCFRLLLGRNPNPDEWRGHALFAGSRLDEVVATYLNSQEFKQRGLLKQSFAEIRLLELDDFSIFVDINDKAVGGPLCAHRSYEGYVSGVFRQCLRPGMTVVDVGANIGYYTLLAARSVGEAGKVFAVEPSATNVRLLLASCEANRFANVEVYMAGASDTVGIARLNPSFSTASTSSVAPRIEELFSYDITPVYPLDRLLPRDVPVDVVKIDIDGSEMLAMRGATEMLARSRPVIFSEFAPSFLQTYSRVTGEEYLRHFLDLGYRVTVLDPAGEIPCGDDVGKVMGLFSKAMSTHIDLVLRPR